MSPPPSSLCALEKITFPRLRVTVQRKERLGAKFEHRGGSGRLHRMSTSLPRRLHPRSEPFPSSSNQLPLTYNHSPSYMPCGKANALRNVFSRPFNAVALTARTPVGFARSTSLPRHTTETEVRMRSRGRDVRGNLFAACLTLNRFHLLLTPPLPFPHFHLQQYLHQQYFHLQHLQLWV